MRSQSELLKALVEVAKRRGFLIKETRRSFDFYKDNILVGKFYKFIVDYTMSEEEFKIKIEWIENLMLPLKDRTDYEL